MWCPSVIESLWFGCHYPSILVPMQTSLINCKHCHRAGSSFYFLISDSEALRIPQSIVPTWLWLCLDILPWATGQSLYLALPFKKIFLVLIPFISPLKYLPCLAGLLNHFLLPLYIFSNFLRFICFYVLECSACMLACAMPTDAGTRHWMPGTGVISCYELPCGCWEVKPGSLEKYPLTAGSAL